MAKKFYISDWHYGHANCIGFDNRPFNNVEEMNSALIANWNKAVAPEDTVYVLGDMFWKTTSDSVKVLDKLNGTKILVKGNHDRCDNENFRHAFARITDYLEVNDDGRKVVLCHYPIPCFKNHFYGWYHLYGHVHSSFEHNMIESFRRQMTELYDKQCSMFNVGVMMPWMNYTPKTLDQIVDGYMEAYENEANQA